MPVLKASRTDLKASVGEAPITGAAAERGPSSATAAGVAAAKTRAPSPYASTLLVSIAVLFIKRARVGHGAAARRPDRLRIFPECPRAIVRLARGPDGAPT